MRVIMLALALPHFAVHGAPPPPVSAKQKQTTDAKQKQTTDAKQKQTVPAAKMVQVAEKELKLLKDLDASYQAKSAEMKVEKVTKLPLMDQERRAKGTLWISNGKLRMELEGSEKTLLVVNRKNLWAVTYPAAEFKDAAVQVIKADTATKKGRSKSFVGLLSSGGFLKYFTATGAQKGENGSVLFFLSPKQEQVEFKRAQVRVSGDGQKLLSLNYWDELDNETRLEFSDVKFNIIDDKLFQYTPPANADVMKI